MVTVEVIVDAPWSNGTDTEHFKSLATFVCAREGAGDTWEIAILLTGDEQIRTLHAQFLGVNESTDVMTFPRVPAGYPSPDPEVMGGDIVISVERAAAQARQYGVTFEYELLFLIAHGVLHLLGWPDDSDDPRKRMLQHQDDLIAAFTVARQMDGA